MSTWGGVIAACALAHPGSLPTKGRPRPRPQPPRGRRVGAAPGGAPGPSAPVARQGGGAQGESGRRGRGLSPLSARGSAPGPAAPITGPAPARRRRPALRGVGSVPSASRPRGSGSCVRPPAPSLAGRSAVASGPRDPRPSTPDPAGRPRRGGGGGGARAPCPCGAAAAPWPGISGDSRGGSGRTRVGAGGRRRLPAASLCPQPRSPGHGHARNPRAGCRRRSAAKFQGRVATRPLRMVLFPHKTPNKLSSWARAAGTKFSGCDLAPRPGRSRGRGSWRRGLGEQGGRRGASGSGSPPGCPSGRHRAARTEAPRWPRESSHLSNAKRPRALRLDGAVEVPELGEEGYHRTSAGF